jgi:LuxR family transcriptional regulator, maltose regulon positive regulatory protein
MTGAWGVRFGPPVLGRACIERPRLLERLFERFARRLTVVIAPAGMGKTTLLAQVVEAQRGSETHVDFWLTCCPDDAAQSSLAEGLCRTMGIAPPMTLDESIDALVDGMWHRSPAEVSLVLDDVHEIPEGSSGAELLSKLIVALPRNGHLVVAGRSAPPVAMSRLDVQGEVVRVGEPDLLFTDDERRAFAAQRGVPADRLVECGGWPALSELAVTAAPQVEAAYLWEEVLNRLPAQRRHDLALLAHIGPFDESLASAALEREVKVAGLMADLPLVAATSTGGWQIHGLWRSHLANAVDREEIAGARRRVGLSLASSGDMATAIRQLARAEAWDDLTTVVTDALGAAHPLVAGDVVASWLGQLPEHLGHSPLARLLRAVANVQRDPRASIHDLQTAAEAFREEGYRDGELACLAQLAQLAWWAEDPSLMGSLTLRLFEMEASGYEKAFPLACVGRALVADLMADSQRVLDELSRIPLGSLHGTWQSLVEWLRSMALHNLGRIGESLEAAARACSTAGPLLAPVIESTRLQALWYLGDTQPALEGLPRLADWAAGAGMRDNAALIAAGAAMAHAAVGGTREALRYLELARRSVATPDAPLVDVYLTVAGAATAIAQGDEAAAARLLNDYLHRSPVLDAGVAASAQRRSLTLWYVLVPTTRNVWEGAELGPCYALARDLGRVLVAVREETLSKAQLPALDEPRMVWALLPAPWAIELALAYSAASRPEGWPLLEAMWPQAQTAVRRHAEVSGGSIGKAARAALGRLPVPPAARLELKLLGSTMELRREGDLLDAPEWRRERVRSLLAYLALYRPSNRERVALELWPKLDAEAQLRNLRVTLSHLLRALEPERAERDASFLVRSHGSGLLLHENEWLEVDLWRFDEVWALAMAADREARPPAALDAMLEAVRLWRGYPSELALNDWALPAVEERRLRLVSMACRAGELLLAHGEHDEARQLAETALDSDPWCERAHHVVIAAHEAAGQHRAARSARHRYDDVRRELGTV